MNAKVSQLALDSFRRNVYKKNINYMFNSNISEEEFLLTKAVSGSPGMSSFLIQQVHRRVGVQMQVSRAVSDDLIATDFTGAVKLNDVPWISPVVEVYFHDPLLPTILLMKASPDELQKWVPEIKIGLTGSEYLTALMQEGSGVESKQLSLQIKPDMYQAFMNDAEAPLMELGPLGLQLNEQDNSAMSFMLNLSLKVFAFASIPTYKPQLITKKQMTYGGKPTVLNRPSRPTFHTTYMPQVIYSKSKVTSFDENRSRDFHGKRGHIHWYRNECFVNRKGTWDFVHPIIDPKTGKYPEHNIIKIRKPN